MYVTGGGGGGRASYREVQLSSPASQSTANTCDNTRPAQKNRFESRGMSLDRVLLV